MKVLVIEDEVPASKKLIRLLSGFDQGIEVLDVLESVEKVTNWLSVNPHPELIFMDVQLEDGICFEIFENVEIKSPVIFTTAYDEYALKAFKVNSVDYLLKPLHSEELKTAIQKYRSVYQNRGDLRRIESLIDQLSPSCKERFLIKVGEHYRSIQVADINCFFVEERCNFILLNDGRRYAVDYSLEKVEARVDQKQFFRINRNFIINYSAVTDILVYSSNRLKISLQNWDGEDAIVVSRDRVSDFKKWMDR